MVTITDGLCESCGEERGTPPPVKTLEDSFVTEEMKKQGICEDCFRKRFKIGTKKRSGYGGTIYEVEEKPAPRFGVGSRKLSCLKCSWVAWTEEGLAAHMKQKHS
ncbi:MAG: hypothetical protein ACFFEF_15745 [Candidatus Thorarchaeota archaeon]